MCITRIHEKFAGGAKKKKKPDRRLAAKKRRIILSKVEMSTSKLTAGYAIF
jgi:hypothetical protein